MSNPDSRLFLRSFGAVIPSTAIGTILFTTWTETSYKIDRSERVINPMVDTTETVHASAILQIVDPAIAKILSPEEEDEDEEEEEQPKRRRGRPAKKEVETSFEPIELEIVFFKKSHVTASEPLNISSPIQEISDKSEKNERVIRGRINHYSGLFSQLESIRENLAEDVAGATAELASTVDDMITGGGANLNGLQQSTVEEYRAKQRRNETRIVAQIDETLDEFQATIDKRCSFVTEAVPLRADIQFGDSTEKALAIVNKFFETELVSID